MPLLWFVLCSTLPLLAHLSGPDRCVHESSSLQNVEMQVKALQYVYSIQKCCDFSGPKRRDDSPLLKSLQCYNDYRSFVQCEWSDNKNTTLELCFTTPKTPSMQCLSDCAAVQDASDHRTVRCKYKTVALAIGIIHTFFFLKNETETLCTSVSHKPLDLSHFLRARPPVSLSTHAAGDGGWRLRWSSPYPSSSSLNKNITYQLSYRRHGQDNWTTADVTNTSMKLEKQSLLPGCRYEARVRARASVGQWSHWSPVVTWYTKEDAGQFPSLHCVLDGEKQVMCSWEVSRELAHFITYQLACRHNQTAPPERCCVNPTPDLSGTVLKYSCSLSVTDPAHLLLELLPTRSAKDFRTSQHIRPDPPQNVRVSEMDSNWMVEWTKPSTEVNLYYQLCYSRTDDQGCTILNVSEGSLSQNILGASLAPSQQYQVRVRSLVIPTQFHGGIPSEWTKPVSWTSHEATWSLTTLSYVSISVVVAAAFLTLYCTIPACQRRVILWVDSVPSPEKSKILTEFKSATSWTLMQSENTSTCKVQHLDSLSTCSSDASLWPNEDIEKKHLEQDEGCWNCDNQLSLVEEVNSSDTSFVSFSGPYILCQTSEANRNPEDVKCEEEEKDDSASSSPVNFSIYGEGYVGLPGRNVSRSTQDLVSHSDANTSTHRHDSAAQDQHHPDKTDIQPDLSTPTSSHQPPAYTSQPFSPWPQGGIMASGYCHLPQPI